MKWSYFFVYMTPLTVNPPSIVMTWPVTNDAAGKQRKATADDTSFVSAILFIGVRETYLSKSLPSSIYPKGNMKSELKVEAKQ